MTPVKCLVWDLDDTLWEGALLEGGGHDVSPVARQAIEELDRRGILHSIASRNDPEAALEALARHGLLEYFVVPQIGWNAKSSSICAIAEELRIGVDAIAFVDDQPFERDEVRHVLPEVRCYAVEELPSLAMLDVFTPDVVTAEAAARRFLYQAEARRSRDEATFEGPTAEFLAGLGLTMTIWAAEPADVARAAELTVRTHQLNTSGVTYTADELAVLAERDDHLVLLARLHDRYGDYGTIGLAVVQIGTVWRVKLLLMSCRVLGRGVGGSLLREVLELAADVGADVEADLVPNGRNRMMLVTLRLAGFGETGVATGACLLRRPSGRMPPAAHVTVLRGT